MCAPCHDSNCKQCFKNIYAPPEEYDQCLTCKETYILMAGVCKKIPTCSVVRQYLTLTPDPDYAGSFIALCTDCPNGCAECKAENAFDQLSAVFCLSCSTDFSLNKDLFKCVPDVYITAPTCTATQFLFLTDSKTWECKDCPAECTSCLSTDICTACAAGHYLNNDVRQCLALPSCGATQAVLAYSSDLFECRACPQFCSACVFTDIFDAASLQCTACTATNYKVSNGRCVATYTAGVPVSDSFCQDSLLYHVVIGGTTLHCLPCPEGCAACKLADFTNQNSALTCSRCLAGFTLSQQQCFPQCPQSNEFFDTISGLCQPCDVSCSTCSGFGNAACVLCAPGFELNDRKECVKFTNSILKDAACPGLDTVFQISSQSCICIDSSKFFDPTTQTCLTLAQFSSTCPTGQFKLGSECLPCRSNDNKQLCAACSNGQPSGCLNCVTGYFLARSTFTCQPCIANCALCQSSTICQRCKDGFFIYSTVVDGVQVDSCTLGCPAGALPFLPSLFELNPHLFTDAQLKEFQDQISQYSQISQADAVAGKLALAVTGDGLPYFKELPWKMIFNKPVFQGQTVNLQCIDCTKNCGTCTADRLLLTSKECISSANCPIGTVKRTINGGQICILPSSQALEVYAITVPSLDRTLQIQPFEQDLQVEVFTTQDSGSTGNVLSYTWEVIAVKKDVAGLKIAFPALS